MTFSRDQAPSPYARPTTSHAYGRPLRVVAVTSGKGGVGKTHVAVNIAASWARAGRKVLLIDGDVGLANADILLDELPRLTLANVLAGECSLAETLVRTRFGVTVLPGASGVPELVALGGDARALLLEGLSSLGDEFDSVIVDTEAGLGPNVAFFAGAAQEVIVVTTPEPTALADAYGVIKMLARRAGVRDVSLLVNQVDAADDARDVFARLSDLVGRFLPVRVDFAGSIPYDGCVRDATRTRQPVTAAYATAPASRALSNLADRLLMRPAPNAAAGRLQFFWERLFAGEILHRSMRHRADNLVDADPPTSQALLWKNPEPRVPPRNADAASWRRPTGR